MKNEAASTAIPTPGLVAATIRPPIAAPPMKLALLPRLRSEFADWSMRCGTVWGTIPTAAGKKNAELSPFAAASAISCQIWAWPLSRSNAIAAWLMPLATLEMTITRLRGRRSGPDPADEQEEHLRDRSRGENEAEVGLRAGQVKDGERERDVRERVADERDRAAEEERRNSRWPRGPARRRLIMEPTGLEPVPYWLPANRSPN
jgi:hypothetical protein